MFKFSTKSVGFKRSLFYSVAIFVVFQFSIIPLNFNQNAIYLVLGFVGYGIVLSEILYSGMNNYLIPIAKDIKLSWKKLEFEKLLQHLILPSILYFSGLAFLFFNRVKLLDQIAILIMTFSFLLIFYNVDLIYRKKYSIRQEVFDIFDFLNIIIFYFGTDVIVNLVYYKGFEEWIIYFGVGLLTLVLIGQMIFISKQYSPKIVATWILSALFVSLISSLVLVIPIFHLATISLLITIVFYLIDVYWHHKIEGTFNWDSMFQYILYAVMAIILLMSL